MPEEAAKEKKELTPEQQAMLESKRAVFRTLYEVVAEKGVEDTRESIDLLTEEMFGSTAKEQNERKLNSFNLAPIANEEAEKLKALLADLTFSEAQEFLGALANAVTFHANRKMKDVPVKELGIKIY